MFLAQCAHDIAMSHGLAISMLLAGLVGGVTHCVGMCSPFVLAQIGEKREIRKLSSVLMIPYHLGRMTTYVFLAVVMNTVVNLAFAYSDLKLIITAPMLVVAAVVFLVSAFPNLYTVFPWAQHFRFLKLYEFITKHSTSFMNRQGVLGRYSLGLLLGFMPCGLVVAALLASATAPNMVQAAFAMSAFTVGTMPALILVAFGGNALKYKYPVLASRLSQGAMVISSLWLFVLAGLMVL